MSSRPHVSVIMTAFNEERFIGEAITALLGQTEKNLELIVINDGSTDGTEAVVQRLGDERLRLISRERRGRVASLNEGIARSGAPFVAINDADDVSEPDRLEAELRTLKQNPELVIVGGFYRLIDERGTAIEEVAAPLGDTDIKRRLFLGSPFGHSSVLMRKAAVSSVGGYREGYPAEEYDLFSRLASEGLMQNLPRTLYRYRLKTSGISSAEEAITESRRRTAAEHWSRAPFPALSPAEIIAGAGPYRERGLLDLYRGDQAALTKLLWHRGARGDALRNWLGLFVIDPRGALGLMKPAEQPREP